jgi:hypothetical protein
MQSSFFFLLLPFVVEFNSKGIKKKFVKKSIKEGGDSCTNEFLLLFILSLSYTTSMIPRI